MAISLDYIDEYRLNFTNLDDATYVEVIEQILGLVYEFEDVSPDEQDVNIIFEMLLDFYAEPQMSCLYVVSELLNHKEEFKSFITKAIAVKYM